MRRVWLLLPAFIVSVVAVIGIMNTGTDTQCAGGEADGEEDRENGQELVPVVSTEPDQHQEPLVDVADQPYVAWPLPLSRQGFALEVRAGERVDVALITMPDRSPGNLAKISVTTVLTNALVLENRGLDNRQPESSFNDDNLHTLVLAVAPADIRQLILARHTGNLEVLPAGQRFVGSANVRQLFPDLVRVTEFRGANGTVSSSSSSSNGRSAGVW